MYDCIECLCIRSTANAASLGHQNPDAPASDFGEWQEELMCKCDIFSRRLEEFEVDVAEDFGHGEEHFSSSKTGCVKYVSSLESAGSRRGPTDFKPIHCRDPLPKATRYFSSFWRPSRSIHRSGTKLYESGKMVSLWCMKTLVIPTGV